MISPLSEINNYSHSFLIVVKVYDVITLISRNSLFQESRSKYWEYIPSAILQSKQFIDESSSQSGLPVITAFRIGISGEIIYIVEAIDQLTIQHAMVNSS